MGDSVADAARDAEAVMTMLAADAAAEAVALGPGGVCEALPPGAVHVSMSTIGVARGYGWLDVAALGRVAADDAGL